MNKQNRALLIISSRLLSYPDEDMQEQQWRDLVLETVASEQVKQDITAFLQTFYRLPLQKRQELYVQTFDLKSRSGLYLTAHELGDSNKRGAALIKLQKLVNQAGFEREEGELADYMPMLFEFMAVAPESKEKERLYRRLSAACYRIKENLDQDNPYYRMFDVLMKYVFSKPTEEELKQLENGREEADLEEMPYPIMYQ